MDDLGVSIQIKQWNCIILQIQEKVPASKSRKISYEASEALKEASSQKSIAEAKANQ